MDHLQKSVFRSFTRTKLVRWLSSVARCNTEYLYRAGKIDYATYCNRLAYPQTWSLSYHFPFSHRWIRLRKPAFYFPFCCRRIEARGILLHNPLHCVAEFLCGILIGHETSQTEFGYGGGDFIDRNCRWCDKLLKEPIAESVWATEGLLSDVIEQMRNGDLEADEE